MCYNFLCKEGCLMKKISWNEIDIKKILNNIYKKTIRYIKYNRLFLSFVLLSLISVTLLRGFTVGNWFSIKTILFDLAVIVFFGSFGFFLKPKNQFIYYFINFVIYDLICIVNAIYFSFYSSFPSF